MDIHEKQQDFMLKQALGRIGIKARIKKTDKVNKEQIEKEALNTFINFYKDKGKKQNDGPERTPYKVNGGPDKTSGPELNKISGETTGGFGIEGEALRGAKQAPNL